MRDGVKIAVLGLLTPTIPSWLNESLWKGLAFEEMVKSARQWVKYIKEVEHADLILGLFHSGREGGITTDDGIEEDASERVAREVPGFDIIFFGHDHRQYNGWVNNSEGKQVLMLDPSCFAANVADAQIEMTYERGLLVKKEIKGDIVSVRNEPNHWWIASRPMWNGVSDILRPQHAHATVISATRRLPTSSTTCS